MQNQPGRAARDQALRLPILSLLTVPCSPPRTVMAFPRFCRMDDIRCFVSRTWQVSWPMTLIMAFEFLISLTDVYVAGKISKEVQAAYGFVVQIYFISIVIANALTVGTVSVVSKLFTGQGPGDRERLAVAASSSLVTAALAGVTVSAIGLVCLPFIVGWLNIPEDVKGHVLPLGRIYLVGIFFHYVLITGNGVLRSCQGVRKSLKTMALVCGCNLLLIFFFVFHTALGYRGIALATAVSVALGSVLNLRHLRPFMPAFRRLSWGVVRNISAIGWPMGLLQVLWQLGSAALFLILSMLPEHSVETLAAFTAGLRIESAIFLPAFAFNMANAVIVGNLLGERKDQEAYRSGLVTAGIGVGLVSALTILVILNARWIAGTLSDNEIVVRESIRYIYISLISEPFMAWGVILGGGLGGAGDTRSVMLRIAAAVWLVRIPLCYVCVTILGLGANSVWWAMNASQVVQALLLTRRYTGKAWLRVKPHG
ncbi:MAG: MATE family efflux transporter [Thermodesulfobacteriota bacterium]